MSDMKQISSMHVKQKYESWESWKLQQSQWTRGEISEMNEDQFGFYMDICLIVPTLCIPKKGRISHCIKQHSVLSLLFVVFLVHTRKRGGNENLFIPLIMKNDVNIHWYFDTCIHSPKLYSAKKKIRYI